MTDRELLELAAKANGRIASDGLGECHDFETGNRWNPLTDDGDALRLAIKLRLVIDTRGRLKSATGKSTYSYHEEHSDEYAATRRAIVRAAAEIGRNMK